MHVNTGNSLLLVQKTAGTRLRKFDRGGGETLRDETYGVKILINFLISRNLDDLVLFHSLLLSYQVRSMFFDSTGGSRVTRPSGLRSLWPPQWNIFRSTAGTGFVSAGLAPALNMLDESLEDGQLRKNDKRHRLRLNHATHASLVTTASEAHNLILLRGLHRLVAITGKNKGGTLTQLYY